MTPAQPSATPAERAAMHRALALAATDGVPRGPNPRVGCVLLRPDGGEVAEGFHRGAGTAHAEVDALSRAGEAARGATAVVTLEPCNHTGRTGPCAEALAEAGVARVVYAQPDSSVSAGGGADRLRTRGIDVVGGLLAEEARQLNPAWTFALDRGRPFVTWKFAASLDGRSAAADGTSRWVSNEAARRDTHRRRAECDVILAGTGTVLIDDPQLSVRDEVDQPLPREHQPMRAVMGLREVPATARVLDEAAPTRLLRTRDPREALEALYADQRHHVFLEGGPMLAGAFLSAGLIDEVVAYVSPMLLGGGTHCIEGLEVATIADSVRFDVGEVDVIGLGHDLNVRLVLLPRPPGALPSPREA